MYDPSDLIGKRKKKYGKCPNPLFCKWIEEWRDAAAAKGNKTQYTFAKALRSMKKYPLPLSTGKECKFLEYCGEKTCKMLDAKLAEHKAIYGDDLDPDVILDPSEKKKIKSASSTITSPVKSPNHFTNLHEKSVEPLSHQHLGQDDLLHSKTKAPKQKSRTPSGPKEYIPAYRSGAYALILTLYRNQQDVNGRGYMLKKELMESAQSICDASFTISDPGCHYTAFASMSTLIRKGLVIKKSSPAKYSLTEAGAELAHKINSAESKTDATMNNPQLPFTVGTASPVKRKTPEQKVPAKKRRNQDNLDVLSSPEKSPQKQPTLGNYVISPIKNNTSRLSYWYVADDGSLMDRKNDAAVTFDEEMSVGFLVKCKHDSLLSSGYHFKFDNERIKEGEFVYVFLPDDVTDEVCLPPKLKNISGGNVINTKTSPLKQSLIPETLYSNSQSCINSQLSSETLSSNSQSCINSQLSSSSYRKPVTYFSLIPGEFDIILVVDNCEHYGASTGKQNLLPELMKNGVDCVVRKLHVGDFLWIAKERVLPLSGQLEMPESREIVLDFVIERKRMDDLAGSIKDGRFKEQKFRMKHSGLRKPIYLVEDYGNQVFSLPEETLQRSIINTQVIDGFYIKRTRDTKESVAYLTVMTRFIQRYFNNKKLTACSQEDIKTIDATFDINDDEHLLMKFSEFNTGSVKNKVMTIKETFGKQLLQIAGMSAEKTHAVLEKYSTVQQLLTAYDICATDKEKENLLSKIKSGALKRNLGIALSRVIYLLYNNKGCLS